MPKLNKNSIVAIGFPFDDSSSFKKGAAQAPIKIIETLFNGSANLCAEDGFDIGKYNDFHQIGNAYLNGSAEEKFTSIEKSITGLLENDARIISLGGDHSITYPIIKGFAKFYNDLTIIQFDAHPDLYDNYEGNKLSNACPFARIMEKKSAKKLIQVGVRTFNKHQREQAKIFNVESIEMKNLLGDLMFNINTPVYISVDIDVLDPAFAPGVSHFEPGGMSVRELLKIIQSINVPIVGADIVEYNPANDINGMTAMVAAKIFKEISALIYKNLEKANLLEKNEYSAFGEDAKF